MSERLSRLWVAFIWLLAVCGASACLASTALAGGEWRIETRTLAELKETKVPVDGSNNESFTLSVPWYETTITCVSTIVNMTLTPGGESTATLSLSSCKLTGPPFVTETCKLTEPVEAELKGSLTLHAAKTFYLFEPVEAGKPLAFFKFQEGTECPLPLSSELTGALAAEAKTSEAASRSLTFKPSVQELAGKAIEFNGHPATLKTALILKLIGGHAGKTWAGVAGPPSEEEAAEEWKIRGSTLENLELQEAPILGSSEALTFTLEVTALQWVLKCTSATLSGFKLQQEGQLSGTMIFTSCSVVIKGVPSPKCAPITPVEGKLKGRLFLHKGSAATYVLFEEQIAKSGAIFLFTLPPFGCVMTGAKGASGTFVAECGSCASEEATHTLSMNSTLRALMPADALTFGSDTPRIDGTLPLDLAAPSKGFAWSGISY